MATEHLKQAAAALASRSQSSAYAPPTNNASTPPPRPSSATPAPRRSTRSRAVAAPATPQQPKQQLQQPQQQQQQQKPQQQQQAAQPKRASASSAPLPTTPQALHTTYPSRLRTGATLLVQPILVPSTTAGASTTANTGGRDGGGGGGGAGPSTPAATPAHAHQSSRASRRAAAQAAISYAEPPSADEMLDGGEADSDGSDFVASGGLRTSVRNARIAGGGIAAAASPRPGARGAAAAATASGELDQSYLGLIPPARYILPKHAQPTKFDSYTLDDLEAQSTLASAPIPVRVELETDTHRVRDAFVWDAAQRTVSPEQFARAFCADLDLPVGGGGGGGWVETVAAQIRAQVEEHEGVAAMDLAVDGALDVGAGAGPWDVPECRVVLSIDVQIDNHHLTDHIEWDLRSPLTPEAFTRQLVLDLGLSSEALPLISHAIHEELLKHKKDAIEWGVIEGAAADEGPKDKTGLGMGWSRSRGPRVLRSVWRDWAEAEEFGTRFEEMSAEEVERREIERERASRRLRRETSKFQSSARTRRR